MDSNPASFGIVTQYGTVVWNPDSRTNLRIAASLERLSERATILNVWVTLNSKTTNNRLVENEFIPLRKGGDD